MKKLSVILFASLALLATNQATAQTSADTAKTKPSKYVIEAKPDPAGVKKVKRVQRNFDVGNFKMVGGLSSPTGGINAPFGNGIYANISGIGRAFKKKGAFELIVGTDVLTGSKAWGARSVGQPVDSVTHFQNGGFDMYLGTAFYWTVLNRKHVTVFTGIQLAGVWGFLPDVGTTVDGARNSLAEIGLFTYGPKISAMILGHLVLEAEYVVGMPNKYTQENTYTNVKTKTAMNTNMTRLGIGFRL